ncbi:putative ubiquinone biosynthesis monooxygenase [Steccherinum ochraceum]|uniref:Ubiquinone biosynthesis monooxygenase COQ6, mitochondrial n=1 Tax=Steccherinum ochraceum TaxID=92696 RepID=A0A4R0RGG0_9APHY|nr:putative ubiquinone biosynthesis monooxygenase [Steccherinum ochraceum]
MLASTSRLSARTARKHLFATSTRQYASSSTVEHSDVVIVGGGPAGLALAGALNSSKLVRDNMRVTLIEAGDLSKTKAWQMSPDAYSNRVSSITNASRDFLSNIGAWSHVDETRTGSVEEMQVWDGVSDARITFSAADMTVGGQSIGELSRLTENLNLQRALLRQLESSSSFELVDKVKVESITTDNREGGAWPVLHLSDGRAIRARLLVGADGFNSPVRSYAGIESYGWAYDTHGVVATLQHAPRSTYGPRNTIAYQRFLPTGPIAFLPLSETASTMVWSTRPHLASALKAVDPSVLVNMVNAAFRLPEVSMRYLHDRLLEAHSAGSPLTSDQLQEELSFREMSHSISPYSPLSSLSTQNSEGIPLEGAESFPPLVKAIQPGTVASFPLRFSHADSYIGEGRGARTVLLGDAAHTTHPLAGQGLNLGLADAEALAQCIETSLSRGGDIGSYTSLLPYARARYFENHKMLSAVDKLHKLYSTTAEPVVWARSVGLEVLNELDTIKTALMVSAGSQRLGGNPGAVGLGFAAQGMEGLARSFSNVKIAGDIISGMVQAGLQQVLRK